MFDGVQWALFENVTALLLLWSVVQLSLFIRWTRQRTQNARRLLWIGLILLPTTVTCSILVQTSREAVVNLCQSLALAVEQGDASTIAGTLDPDFQSEGLTKDGFLVRVDALFDRFTIERIRLHGFHVTFPDEGTAIAEFRATCSVRSKEAYDDRLITSWRLTLKHDPPKSWSSSTHPYKVIGVEIIRTSLSPITNLRDFLN